MFRYTWRLTAITAAAVLAAATMQPAAARVRAQATLQVIAQGLDNPRGLNFGPEGNLYVAEAGTGGSGPCFTTSEPAFVCYGATGAITRLNPSVPGSQTRIITGLPSLAPPPGAQGAGARASGPQDVGFQGRGNGYVTIGLGSNPASRIDLGSVGAQFGQLLRFQPNGKYKFDADLAAFEGLANPDGVQIDSNPCGLLRLPGRQVYTDAGGNALNAVAANGSISNLAVFPTRNMQNPFAPPGVMVPMQAVPTTVTTGPDGALYVGQLTGFPFPQGGARVYRVPEAGGTPDIYADGFTNIIDIAFGPDGSLYVLEIYANGLLSGDETGALIRVAKDGTKTTIASEGLVTPGGVAVGPDGALYVTNHAISPGGGEVLKIVP
jgi:hypothetical protein